MAYKLIITHEANIDIDEIIGYIANVLKNPIAAGRLLSDIEDNFKIISENPEAFAYCSDKRLHDSGYRKIPVKNYIIFYRVDSSDGIVYIMRVLYGRRNYTDFI